MLRQVVLLAALVGGCAPAIHDPQDPVPSGDEWEVRAAAETDLDCAADEITIARAIDAPEEYVAAGCGRSARYEVSCTSRSTSMSTSHSEDCSATRLDADDWYEDDDDDE